MNEELSKHLGLAQQPPDSHIAQLIDFLIGMTHGVRIMKKTAVDEYATVTDYVLDRGIHYPVQELTAEQRTYIDQVMRGGWDYELKQCFANAQWAVVNDFDKRLTYIEGYAFGQAFIPVHHAWVVIDGDTPVELTWRDTRSTDVWTDPSLIQPFASFAYLGIPFDTERIRDRMYEEESLCTFLDDWQKGWPELQKKRLHPFPGEGAT